MDKGNSLHNYVEWRNGEIHLLKESLKTAYFCCTCNFFTHNPDLHLYWLTSCLHLFLPTLCLHVLNYLPQSIWKLLSQSAEHGRTQRVLTDAGTSVFCRSHSSTGHCVVDIQTNWTGSPGMLKLMLSRGHLLACFYIGSTCTMTCAYRTVESDL